MSVLRFVDPWDVDKMRWQMVSCGMHGGPVPLELLDPSSSFVYERRWGAFHVGVGHHQLAMSLLLAWQHNCEKGVDVAEKLGLEFSSGTADHWLETTPGAAFKSSVGKRIQVATTKALTIQERRLFGDVCCVF